MITQKDVEYIASLARIHLKPDEIQKLTVNLEAILGYIEKLKELNVSEVQPTSHVLPLHNVYRADLIKSSLSQEEALKIAPEKENGAFKVPQVIE